jgi:hypothetical protein
MEAPVVAPGKAVHVAGIGAVDAGLSRRLHCLGPVAKVTVSTDCEDPLWVSKSVSVQQVQVGAGPRGSQARAAPSVLNRCPVDALAIQQRPT